MATTRLITIHISKGKGAGKSFSDRLDYACNPEKTEKGQLVTGFACDPITAANEFELMRKAYQKLISGPFADSNLVDIAERICADLDRLLVEHIWPTEKKTQEQRQAEEIARPNKKTKTQ